MFIAGKDGSSMPTGSTAPAQKSMGLWMSIIVPNAFFFVALIMNTTCFIIMVIKSRCTFTSSLNLLMMTFLLTMAYYSLNNMVCSIMGEAMDMSAGTVTLRINQTGDLFSSYFSIILLFLVGMNRAAVYCSPWLVRHFFPRRRLLLILIFLALLCLLLSCLVYMEAGMERVMASDGVYQDYVQDMTLMKISNYISYGIALSSCLFYIRVYYHLRQQRSGVVHDKTRELLGKAELLNCRQGGFVLIIYSLSLVLFVVSENVDPDANFALYIHAVQEVVQCLPSLAIPLALLCFCKEMQTVLTFMLTGGRRGKRCDNGRSSADSHGRKTATTALSNVTSF